MEVKPSLNIDMKCIDIFNTVFDSILIIDSSGSILEINDATIIMLGYERDELVGKSIFTLIVEVMDELEEDLFGEIDIKKLITNGMINGRKLTLKSKDQVEIPVLLSSSHGGKIEGESIIVCTAKDVTAIVESSKNLEMERSIAMNSAKMAALGEMAAGIAHELNTPLAVITGRCYHLEDMLSEGGLDKEFLSQSIKAIDDTTKKISSIVKGLRSISRDSHDDPFIDSSISQIIEDTLAFCKYKLDENKIKVKINSDKLEQGFLFQCRAAEISQVILNLINNSIDAIRSLEERWISINLLKDETYLFIEVADSGSGISSQIREKIMQPFFTTKDVGKGTGLGLSICRNLIENHGGSFKLDDCADNTKFLISLPINPF